MRRPVGPLRPVAPEPADDTIVGADGEPLTALDNAVVEGVVVERALADRLGRHADFSVVDSHQFAEVGAEQLFHGSALCGGFRRLQAGISVWQSAWKGGIIRT